MSKNKFNEIIKVRSYTSDPSGLEDGDIFYNSTLNAYRVRQGGATKSLAPTDAVSLVADPSPTLGGNLNLSTFAVLQGAQGLKRGDSGTDYLEEQYYHSVALSASQTDTTIATFTFAHATYDTFKMFYRVKEATSNDVRMGDLYVITNGTDIDFVDTGAQTNPTGVTFSAVISGANVIIRYSSGANAATLRADVKRFLV